MVIMISVLTKMRTVIFVFSLAALTSVIAHRPIPGRFRRASSELSDGRYVPDNAGAYYPDNSGTYAGQYTHDNTGIYYHDPSGDYVHEDSPYTHEEPVFVAAKIIKPIYPAPSRTGSFTGISPAGGLGQPVVLQTGNAAGLYDKKNYKILQKIENVNLDGYNYLYETENGILGAEEGKLTNKNTENELIKAKGYYTYTGPDHVVYNVKYTADDNGFVAQGDHIPTPPPIPDAILRSLEYQKSLGEL